MEPYTIEDATKDLFMSEDDFREYLDLLAIKKNIVLAQFLHWLFILQT